MLTLGTHFDKLLENVRPPKERLDAARDMPPKVREYLEKHEGFATLAPHTRLAGSYAQDLSVGDVKDVDFLVRVPGDPLSNEPKAKQLITDLQTALDDLPKFLGHEGWAGVDIERARRSVHVHIKRRDFHLDVVPCIAPNGFEEKLYVPDRGFNQWIASHPIGYVDLLDALNQAHGGKVKKLIKLLKHFRNHQMKNMRPKSYWLGAMVVHHVRREDGLDMAQPLAVLFRDLLDAIYTQYDHLLVVHDEATPHIADPLLDHDISWNWGRSPFETFMRRLNEGRGWATKALESDERHEAIEYWQRIFGEDWFPTNADDEALRLAGAALPGRSYVTPSGLVIPERPLSGRHVPTRPTTFHGSKE